MGLSGDYIPENSQMGVGHSVFSLSYSSNGIGAYKSKRASRLNRVGLGMYKMGDIVGCGIDWSSESYFFTLNGRKDGKIPLLEFCSMG